MGRSFASVRQGVRDHAEQWNRAAARLDRDNRRPAETLSVMAKTHSSAGFFGCNDPLEAMVFSALVEICRTQEEGDRHVDP